MIENFHYIIRVLNLYIKMIMVKNRKKRDYQTKIVWEKLYNN